VTRTERRFAELREHVRARGITGTIGYVEDAPTAVSVRDADVDYFIAQFALLPLVLDSTMSQSPWAIGNFRGPSPTPIPPGWHIVRDFGHGILLLGKSSR
jgi:hypothetical protein